jgi:hypothetical protein
MTRCMVCAGSSGHDPIPGEGTPVCYPCVLRLGRAAADPTALTNTEVLVLLDLHDDVVELRGINGRIYWHWLAA